MKSVLTPISKSVLLPIGLSAGMSEADAAIRKKLHGLGLPSGLTSLIISIEEVENKMKIVKSLEESRLLIIKNKRN